MKRAWDTLNFLERLTVITVIVSILFMGFTVKIQANDAYRKATENEKKIATLIQTHNSVMVELGKIQTQLNIIEKNIEANNTAFDTFKNEFIKKGIKK